ncbi:MAG: hypothetical protein RLZZ500_1239 [Bacteroidota bacterium]|jgi:hypothetical protein
MIQDHAMLRSRHERFVKTVCETQIVYTLKSEEGYATSSSNDYEDEDGNAIPMHCFWSESTLAKSCIQSGWADYHVEELPLVKFIENWCVGMYQDGLMVGTNFDAHMFGYESEPLELVVELLAELKAQSVTLSFTLYDSSEELETIIHQIMGE